MHDRSTETFCCESLYSTAPTHLPRGAAPNGGYLPRTGSVEQYQSGYFSTSPESGRIVIAGHSYTDYSGHTYHGGQIHPSQLRPGQQHVTVSHAGIASYPGSMDRLPSGTQGHVTVDHMHQTASGVQLW